MYKTIRYRVEKTTLANHKLFLVGVDDETIWEKTTISESLKPNLKTKYSKSIFFRKKEIKYINFKKWRNNIIRKLLETTDAKHVYRIVRDRSFDLGWSYKIVYISDCIWENDKKQITRHNETSRTIPSR